MVLPPPTITSLTPNTDQQNSPGFTLEVNGSNFANDAVVNWNGAARPTTFLNSTTLLATITGPGDLATVGDVGVTVLNSADMTTSDPMTFTVTSGCTPTVVNKKTDTNTCGEFRPAVATSPPVTITFALLAGDQIDLTTGPITLASGVTLRAPCSAGPTITLRSTSAANNFVLNGGVSVRGLFFSRVGGGGGNLPVLQATAPGGHNQFSCSKVSQT